MSASRSLAIIAFGAALLSGQPQPHAVIDPVRTLEARYEVARPWWDPGRGTLLPAAKDFDDPSGQLRLLNQSCEVPTRDHAFFTALGANGRACVTCHQPSSAMGLSLDLIRQRWADTDGKDPLFGSQAITAVLAHEQASAAPPAAQLKEIEDFERQFFMAQHWDTLGGLLGEPGGPALLGVENLARGVAGAGAVPTAGNLAASFDPWRNLAAPNLAVRQGAFAHPPCAESISSPRGSSACRTASRAPAPAATCPASAARWVSAPPICPPPRNPPSCPYSASPAKLRRPLTRSWAGAFSLRIPAAPSSPENARMPAPV